MCMLLCVYIYTILHVHIMYIYTIYLSIVSYIKEAALGSIWDTCPAVRTVFAKRPVCHITINSWQLLPKMSQ